VTATRGVGGSRRLGVGAVIVLVLAAFAVTVVIGIVRGGAGSAEEVPLPTGTASASASVVDVYVHVDGAVARPGLYALPAGARVVDAIAAAGGLGEGADQAAVNLARPVSDGEQIVVPVVGAAPSATPGAGGTTGADAPVDLNSADQAALETLPRIGPALAERILAWREENGRFQSVDDLLAVPGIGEKLLAGLRDRVRV
jgi:competence protein ComEA